MNWLIVAVAFAALFSTLIGGLFAIRFRRALPYFFAFASGSLIAVTFFDILPESLQIADSSGIPLRNIMTLVVASFFFYSILEKFFLTHHGHEEDGNEHGHIMGPIGAGGLVVHSFLDGVAIGVSFHISPSVGIIVALAILFHDFTDGINTVTLMLKNKHHVKDAMVFLILDALAPVAGVLITYFVNIQQSVLALILAVFAGEFLYIGASNLLPETHKHTAWKMILSMGLAILLIFALTSII